MLPELTSACRWKVVALLVQRQLAGAEEEEAGREEARGGWTEREGAGRREEGEEPGDTMRAAERE
eukprot:2552258-Rhodomonas_salina.1